MDVNNNYNESDSQTPETEQSDPQNFDPYKEYSQRIYDSPPPGTPLEPMGESNNLATASMVTGILGFLSNICCCFPIGLILGIVSIVLVILSKQGKPFNGLSIAGLILGILSIIASLLIFVFTIFTFSLMKDPEFAPMFNDIYRQYEEIYQSMPK